jgi:nucleotide-binding universal stress UspA family protein
MFKNILIPTDGSELSRKAAKQAMTLARATGSKVTAFHAAPPYTFHVFEDYIPPNFVMPADYAERVKNVAERHLGEVRKLAEEAGVPFEAHYETSDFPGDAIVKAAERYGCDSIVIGSHGRSGVARLMLGSQTQKVLAQANVPVVVVR